MDRRQALSQDATKLTEVDRSEIHMIYLLQLQKNSFYEKMIVCGMSNSRGKYNQN